MNLLSLGNIIKGYINEYLSSQGLENLEYSLEVPSKVEHGELATSIAFKIAKDTKRRPLDVANDIRDFLKEKKIPYIEDVEIAGSGYINFRLVKNDFFRDYFREVDEEGLYPYKELFGGKLYRIEYTSVNPNKALHIGHARNVVLGSSLSRMLSELGNKVHLINYIDDTGTQMADILVGFLKLGFDTAPPPNLTFDKYCGDIVYVESVKKIEESKELQEERKRFIQLIERGDNPVAAFARVVASSVLKNQLRTCWRLGAKYDLLVWESDIVRSGLHKKLADIIEKSTKIIRIKEGKYAGTVAIKISDKKDFDAYIDEVIIRKDGTLTYVGKDLIFALWKMGLINHEFNIKPFIEQPDGSYVYSTTTDESDLKYAPGECDLLFNVIGSEQKKPQNAIREVIRDLFGDEYASKYIHYYYELVDLSSDSVRKYFGVESEKKSVKMSGRKGIYFNVDDVLDTMISEVKELVKKNNPDMSDEEVSKIAEIISVSSLKYSMLSVDRDKKIKFDIEKSLDVTRESGAYILYSYARAKSILRKYNSNPGTYSIDFEILNENDFFLARYMMLFPLYVYDAYRRYELKPLVNYMYKLSMKFNEFYEKNPVLRASYDIREYRVLLTHIFMRILEHLSKLSGIELVEKM